ncbi:MAG: hypothetical protein U0892_08235 [Pirellulales bacterium]
MSRLRSVASILLLLQLFSLSVGCRTFNLPRIDPTGQSIFLPCPNTTQLTIPQVHATPDNPGIFQPDAFPTPVDPPPCLDGSCPEDPGLCNLFKKHSLTKIHDHFAHKGAGAKGEIQLTPLRVVAPVCGEVVLLAGVCGEDGYLVKRQPIEWMLSPESVGQIIEVGDDAKGKLISSLRHGPKVEKLDVDFARGRTSARETVIKRGTPDLDLQLKSGQTWVSISSPSEGISRVTVLAPESEIWDRRRRTATIYWVDAEWCFPESRAVRSGEPVVLTTRVTRSENLVPAEGWRVRYTILDQTVAAFVDPETGRLIETNIAVVQVNTNGQAAVALRANPQSPRGTTPVSIEVIRPAQPSDSLPELILGRGEAMVTFSSPALELAANGPDQAAIGEQVTFHIALGNAGDLDDENVRLIAQWPGAMELISASYQPTGAVTNAGASWDQGTLRAREQFDLALTFAMKAPGTFNLELQAVAAPKAVGQPNMQEVVNKQITVSQPQVNLTVAAAGGIAQAEAGQVIEYDIAVDTQGQTMTGLKLVVDTSPGLVEVNQRATHVERELPVLARGAPVQMGIAFLVQQEGEHRGTVKVLSPTNSVIATRDISVVGLPRRPQQPAVEVSIRPESEFVVGNRAKVLFDVRNTGQTTLRNIQVQITSDEVLEATDSDRANSQWIKGRGTQLLWNPQQIELRPGQFLQAEIYYMPRAAAAQARINAEVATAEGARDTKQIPVQIIGSPTAPVNPPGIGGASPQSGDLAIQIFDLQDPVVVGAEVRYVLSVVNNKSTPDRRVRVQISRPQGAEIRSVSRGNVELQTTFSVDSPWVTLPEEQFVRPGEKFEYLFIIVPKVAQVMELRAQVSSELHPTPREVRETTTVNAR